MQWVSSAPTAADALSSAPATTYALVADKAYPSATPFSTATTMALMPAPFTGPSVNPPASGTFFGSGAVASNDAGAFYITLDVSNVDDSSTVGIFIRVCKPVPNSSHARVACMTTASTLLSLCGESLWRSWGGD